MCTHACVFESQDPVICEMQTAHAPLPENSCKRMFFLSPVDSVRWKDATLPQKERVNAFLSKNASARLFPEGGEDTW